MHSPFSLFCRTDEGSTRTVTEDLYRTDLGYVLDAPDVLMPWTPASFFALRDANSEHLRHDRRVP